MKYLQTFRECLTLAVVVASLGYFVDLFDITLFGVVRIASLNAIGLTDPHEYLAAGLYIYNWGMAGMMIGGLLWGVLADKRGRLSVLFASIILYSIANLANAFVWSVNSYALCRFVGGIGLAGELGAAISLVAESLPKDKRGVGTTIVATCGMLGIVAAALFGQLLSWRWAYSVGGFLGLGLLFVRFQLRESALFEKTSAKASVKRGNFWMLLGPKRVVRYLASILIGTPIYFTTAILFSFAPELTKALGVSGPVSAGNAILAGSIGLTLGDLLSGLLSQYLRSRRQAVALCLFGGLAGMLFYILSTNLSPTAIYILCFCIGTATGYWAVLVTMAAEQFGTNIRATAATTVPNFVRGSAVFAVTGFTYLAKVISMTHAALTVGLICYGLALGALLLLRETYGTDLNFVET